MSKVRVLVGTKKGAFVLEEIVRDEDPKYFQHRVFWELLRGGAERRCC